MNYKPDHKSTWFNWQGGTDGKQWRHSTFILAVRELRVKISAKYLFIISVISPQVSGWIHVWNVIVDNPLMHLQKLQLCGFIRGKPQPNHIKQTCILRGIQFTNALRVTPFNSLWMCCNQSTGVFLRVLNSQFPRVLFENADTSI
jgi:hypothetical protein